MEALCYNPWEDDSCTLFNLNIYGFLDYAFLLFVTDRRTCRVQRIREKSTEMSDVISPS